MNRITKIAAALLAAAALGLAACGDEKQAMESAEAVTVTDAWARITPPAAENGAVYMTIASEDGDALTGATVSAEIAAMAQIHETTGHSGMKSMREVERIEVPAGKVVKLEPGGHHVMLMKLARPIAAGDSVPVTLEFERAGEVTVDAVAREG